jgi:hypothetical protein
MSIYIDSLKKKREDLLQKLAIIDEMIADELNTKSINTPESISHSGYNKDGSWPEKIGYIFRSQQRFLHVREITELIQNYEPTLKDEKDLKQKLSANLNRMKHDNILTNKKIGDSVRNIFWGSVNWIDENNNIKNGYEFNPEYLYKKTKKIDLI